MFSLASMHCCLYAQTQLFFSVFITDNWQIIEDSFICNLVIYTETKLYLNYTQTCNEKINETKCNLTCK